MTSDPAPVVVDGRACRTRAALFEEVARVLDFPSYFGHNWDAMVDSLRDVAPVALTMADAEELLVEEPPEQLSTLLAVLATAASDGLTFTLCTTPDREPSLRHRIAAALPPR